MADKDDMPDGRVADFRLLAETAQQMAAKAETPSEREAYLKIAADWLQLADDIQKSK